jgi:hypothetical protein
MEKERETYRERKRQIERERERDIERDIHITGERHIERGGKGRKRGDSELQRERET